ncbi:MAG: LytR C-terminal domain-containing protein, partial [Candidatus Woesebacteria bacterium]|nr:LytR C-terminal domain-containing protein [Candidatus Woesebacteria bacterium]
PVEEAVIEKPQKTEEIKESSFNILWILIPGMLLLGLLIGGIFAYVFGIQKISDTKKADTSENQNITVEPTVSPTAKPTASSSANLSKYKIKILNGSGIKGEAGKVQTLVEAAGFSVLSAGNAVTYDYTKTQITIKTGVDPEFIVALVATLKKDYQLEDPKTVSSQTNDVTVIVGNLKAI